MNKPITLRPYQQECLNVIAMQPPGAYLCRLATGLGKTVIFTHIPRQGKMLILSHREELVHQPLKYFDCVTGVEQGAETAPLDAEVVSASVQSLMRRIERYAPDAFDIIIVDEAHHAAAKSYRTILDHFKPRLLLGFTATPNRADRVRLDNVFSKIIFDRDLRWGVQEGYLSDIFCRRVNIGFDLRSVHTRAGDYAPGELAQAMDGTADAIAEAYRSMAHGATLIFAVNVEQCNEIAKRIPGAEVVTGETKNRAEIIERFTNGEISCIVNCMVFTEGTDIPRVETVMIARPTQSSGLYTQMVGRGLRLYPGKEKLLLIDCVGITGKASLRTAPSLLGIDLTDIPPKRQQELEGMLFELPEKAERAADCPQSWVKNVVTVDLWAQEQQYNTHDVNYFKMPDGSLVCSLMNREMLTIPAPDELGNVCLDGDMIPMQQALDEAYLYLQQEFSDQEYIWNLAKVRRWGSVPATEKQLQLIEKKCRGKYEVPQNMSKMQASQVLNRLLNGGGKYGRSKKA